MKTVRDWEHGPLEIVRTETSSIAIWTGKVTRAMLYHDDQEAPGQQLRLALTFSGDGEIERIYEVETFTELGLEWIDHILPGQRERLT